MSKTQNIESMHMTTMLACQNPKKVGHVGVDKSMLRELNSFVMETVSFVSVNKHGR